MRHILFTNTSNTSKQAGKIKIDYIIIKKKIQIAEKRV